MKLLGNIEEKLLDTGLANDFFEEHKQQNPVPG